MMEDLISRKEALNVVKEHFRKRLFSLETDCDGNILDFEEFDKILRDNKTIVNGILSLKSRGLKNE